MLHDLDDRDDSPIEGGCPRCGSTRMTFRVQRTGQWSHPLTARSLVWECRECGVCWTEAITGQVAPPVDTPGAPQRLVS